MKMAFLPQTCLSTKPYVPYKIIKFVNINKISYPSLSAALNKHRGILYYINE